MTQPTQPTCEVIILTALPIEYQTVLHYLEDLQEVVHPSGTIYHHGQFRGEHQTWRVAVAQIALGGSSAAFETDRAIQFFSASIALFVGTASGLGDVRRGDVIAATKIHAYEYGKDGTTFEPRPEQWKASYPLAQRAQAEARTDAWLARLDGSPRPDAAPRAFVGPLAAGEKVVASTRSDVARRLCAIYGDTLAVETEGHGFLQAVHANHSVHGLVIRGISNLIDDKAETEAAGWSETAAKCAAAFAFQVLSKFAGAGNDRSVTREIDDQSKAHNIAISFLVMAKKDIDGPQLRQLRQAFLSAFPTRRDLELMISDQFNENLSVLVSDGNLEHTVYELVRWAQAQGKLEELIEAALAQNSENPQLLSVATQLGASSGQSSSDIPPATTFPRVWNIPYPRNPFFTGQEDVLTRLTTALKAGQATALSQPQAVTGLGGIGKTQIALEFAYQHRQDYEAVLWVLADTRESLVSGYIAIAQLLGLPQRDEQDQAVIIGAVRSWLQTYGSWLLILDNADELAMVRSFVPASFGGHLLLTTRAQSMGRFAKGIEVETMSRDVGALFLLRRACLVGEHETLDAASSSDGVKAREISEELGGLPLALDQAGAYIDEMKCSLASYLASYRKRRVMLLARRGGLVDDHPLPVAATWSLSFEKVEQQSAVTADLLRVCAFLAPDAIPEEIIKRGAAHFGPSLALVGEDDVALDEAIAPLLAYSLIRRNAQEKTLSMHRLVQAVLKDAMDEQSRRQWAERVVLAVNEVFPAVSFETWPQCERYLPHAQVCAKMIEQGNFTQLEAASLLDRLGWYLREHASYDEAEWVLKRVLFIREETLGQTHRATGQSMNELAHLYFKRGKLTEAEALYERALVIGEAQLVWAPATIVTVLNNLADTCREQGKYEKALKLFQRALTLCKLYGGEHLRTALVLSNLGRLYGEQGRYKEALSLSQQALAIRVKLLLPNHPDVATSLNQVMSLSGFQGKHEQDELLYQQILGIDEKAYGSRHPEVAIDQAALAECYLERGMYEQAEPLLLQALVILEESLGSQHINVAVVLNTLGRLYQERGRYEEAEPLLLRALVIREERLGQEHWETAKSLNNLALLYTKQRKYEQAKLLFLRALAIKEQLDPQHPSTAQGLNNLAVLYQEQERYEEAEPLLHRALALREEQLGSFHPSTAESLHNLACLYTQQGKYGQAESLYQRALAIYEHHVGWDHFHTINCLHHLVKQYETEGKYEQATALLLKTLRVQEQQLGLDHTCTVPHLDKLGQLYTQQGRYREAEPLYQRALAICNAQLGQGHPVTLMVQRNYAYFLRRIGRDAEAALLETSDQHMGH